MLIKKKQMSGWIQGLNFVFLSFVFLGGGGVSDTKITNHLPDTACENSFRLNVMNLIPRQNDNTGMNYCTI